MEKSKPKIITIVLPSDTYFVSGIRDFTLSLVRNLTGLSTHWAYRFQSVVDELCSNAIEHGSGPGESIKVTFVSDPGKQIEVIVEDTGTGPDKVTAAKLEAHMKEKANGSGGPHTGLRGRGLAQIVNQWTSELHFEDVPGGGIRVRAVKYIPDSTAD